MRNIVIEFVLYQYEFLRLVDDGQMPTAYFYMDDTSKPLAKSPKTKSFIQVELECGYLNLCDFFFTGLDGTERWN